MRELELQLVRSCDLTLTVSEAERQTLLADVPGADVAVVPLANDVWTEIAPRQARSGLLFVGNFHHAPNVDAVGYLVRDIMPLIWRAEPDLRLTVVGGFAPRSVTALADYRVSVLGWVPDLGSLLGSSTALVAPLRFGAGVKGKVTQALATGLPVVTTSLGAEGIGCSPREDILVGDTAADFAGCVLELLRDEDLWQMLSRNGQELARATCSPEAQREAVQKLLVRLESRRSATGVGEPETRTPVGSLR